MTAPFTNFPYLKYDPKLFGHPKIKQFAKYLGCSEREAYWYWMGIMSWCGIYSTEGELTKYPLVEVCDFIGYVGDPELLVKAGREARLLDVGTQVPTQVAPSLGATEASHLPGQNQVTVHNWWDWHGDVIESRELANAQAVGGHKGGHVKNHVNKGKTKAGCSSCDEAVASHLGATWVGQVHKEEKSTEENSKEPVVIEDEGDV